MGIAVPPGVRDGLQRALSGAAPHLGELRRSDPRGWHLTLAFVGALAEERVSALGTAVADGVDEGRPPSLDPPLERPLELSVDGAGRFGSRVLFAAVTDRPGGALARLGATLQTTIERAGLPVERREVRPHVTVARAGRTAAVTGEMVDTLQATLAARPPIPWTPQAVVLYRAIDRDGPARYAIEASVPLSFG